MDNKKNCRGKRCSHHNMYYPQGGPSYPWMQRPMPPQPDGWMPWMGARGPLMPMDMPPQPMDDVMGIWTMPQWNTRMWEPEREEDPEEMRDREYWMQMYPGQTRRIQREVEHQCDLMDYEGSVMYDEYPDRIALARICEAVYQGLMQTSENEENNQPTDQVDMTQMGRSDRTLRDLIEVMLYHEMHQRRRKHRRNHRWYFG